MPGWINPLHMGDGHPSLLVGTQNPYGPWAYDRSNGEFRPQHIAVSDLFPRSAGPHNPEGTLLRGFNTENSGKG